MPILYDTAKIEILSAERECYKELNNYSVVIKLYMDVSFLFIDDCEKLVEQELLSKNIDCDVLKVGHHGSSIYGNDY